MCAIWKKVSCKHFHDTTFFAREIVNYCLRVRTSKNLMLFAHKTQRVQLFLTNWTSKIILNSAQPRKTLISNTAGNHEAQVYAKSNVSIWKSRMQLVFSNKYIPSYICNSIHFSARWSRLAFCMCKMGLIGLKIAQVLLQSSLYVVGVIPH